MRAALPIAALCAAACVGDVHGMKVEGAVPSERVLEVPVLVLPPTPPALTPPEAETYLARLAPMVVSRTLSPAERARLLAEGVDAVAPIVTAWTKEPGFTLAARVFIEQMLNVSGTKDGIDFTLPGNLVSHVVSNERPWRDVITETHCYDGAGAVMACDSGSPFEGGGLLNTRAYLKSRAGRFNLTRASTMLRAFACRAYPMEEALQPRTPKEQLMPMFRALTKDEQTDPRAAGGFANGSHCYTCHGQFSFHTQLFVKFDSAGRYQAAANGVQDPEGELGRSTNGTMTSHFDLPEGTPRSGDESSRIFDTPVANLAEAGKVMADSPTFLECTAEHFLNHALGVQWKVVEYDPALMRRIALRAKSSGEPSLGQLVVSLLSDPLVMSSIGKKGASQP